MRITYWRSKTHPRTFIISNLCYPQQQDSKLPSQLQPLPSISRSTRTQGVLLSPKSPAISQESGPSRQGGSSLQALETGRHWRSHRTADQHQSAAPVEVTAIALDLLPARDWSSPRDPGECLAAQPLVSTSGRFGLLLAPFGPVGAPKWPLLAPAGESRPRPRLAPATAQPMPSGGVPHNDLPDQVTSVFSVPSRVPSQSGLENPPSPWTPTRCTPHPFLRCVFGKSGAASDSLEWQKALGIERGDRRRRVGVPIPFWEREA